MVAALTDVKVGGRSSLGILVGGGEKASKACKSADK